MRKTTSHTHLDRREFLTRICNALALGVAVAPVTSGVAAARRATERTMCLSGNPTLAQEYLSIESTIGATAADCSRLSAIMDRILTRMQPAVLRLNVSELRKREAVELLNRIGESFNREGFRFCTHSTLLCTSLRTREIACLHAAAIVFSLGETTGLPLSMLKVPSHVFLRMRLGNGQALNWDIYLENNGIGADDNDYLQSYRLDTKTARRAGYLCNLTRPQMLALEYNALGVAWIAESEWDRAAWSFSEAIALDPRMPEAFKNRGTAKYRRAPAIPGGEPAQRTELLSALADLEEAVRINGNCAEALYSLGLTHFALNEPDSARHFLHSAERLDPNYSRSALSLALNKN